MNKSHGSVAIEALLLVPVLFVIATTVVFVGRLTDAAGTVHHAADIAARVASQSSTNTALGRAHSAAIRSVSTESKECKSPEVTIERMQIQREVHYVVRVRCIVNLGGLGLLSLRSRTVSAVSSEVVDVYTQR